MYSPLIQNHRPAQITDKIGLSETRIEKRRDDQRNEQLSVNRPAGSKRQGFEHKNAGSLEPAFLVTGGEGGIRSFRLIFQYFQ